MENLRFLEIFAVERGQSTELRAVLADGAVPLLADMSVTLGGGSSFDFEQAAVRPLPPNIQTLRNGFNVLSVARNGFKMSEDDISAAREVLGSGKVEHLEFQEVSASSNSKVAEAQFWASVATLTQLRISWPARR
jgi:hypothetical protein